MRRISTDVGGTFTDGVMLDEDTGELQVSKVPTTPDNPATGTLESVELFGVDLREVSFLTHGTTVVINALIESKGALTGLITTRGFRDVLEIGRSNRTDMYDPLYRKPTVLVPRHLRSEVDERMAPDGTVIEPLSENSVREAVASLKEQGVGAVAVCLLNAYANPRHEEEIGKMLQYLWPEVAVSLSHSITRHFYEYERTSTAVQNAYVMPVVARYLRSLEGSLRERRFEREVQIMQSNGGMMGSAVARDIPVAMVESGPAAGAIGAAQLSAQLGFNNVIAYDMGGTTAKTAIAQGGLPDITERYEVEGRPILLPVVDLREIGAGGGSIAWVDEAGALHVGPHSAGADPGPACYMRGGTEPTVTDANVQLGILDPEYFLGGRMEISPEKAAGAIQPIAERFGLSVDEAALGIIRIVNTHMSGLLQSMTIKRGYDPRDFAMVAFGGAGPVHATAVARELQIPTVIVPQSPGVFSAWGMLMADLRHDFARTYVDRLGSADPEAVNGLFRELADQVRALFARDGVADADVTVNRECGIRYYGQEHTLNVTLESQSFDEEARDQLGRDFDELHLRVYGHNAPEEPKELVSLRVTGIGRVPRPALRAVPSGDPSPDPDALTGRRHVFLGNGDYAEFSVYRRARLKAGNGFPGPAIVEEPTATTVIEPGQHCVVDSYGNLIIDVSKEAK